MDKNKKKEQLKINPSTASGRLVKDLLWDFILKSGKGICCKCGKEMTRATFSIEHLKPWLDSDDPIGLYFDINNIAYSHLTCNSGDRRRTLAPCGTRSAYKRGCRCEDCTKASAKDQRDRYCPKTRQKRYREKGI